MKNIKVSVVVPVYNEEKYLKKCLDSIINQTLKEIEVIVINNKSTDKSEEIALSYKERVRYYYLDKKGVGLARNFGIEKAKGEYVLFFDSDDYMREDMCEKLYLLAHKEDLDICCSDYYSVYEKTGKVELTNLYKFNVTNIYEDNKLIYNFNYGPIKLFKREIFDNNKNRFPENLKYEDLLFVVKLLKDVKKIGKVNDNLFYYTVHEDSETTVMDERVFDILKIIKEANNYFGCKENYELMENFTVSQLTNYTVRQRYQLNGKLRNKFIDEAFSYLDRTFPNWRQAGYFKNRSFLKKIVEKNKLFTKLYCKIYVFFINV